MSGIMNQQFRRALAAALGYFWLPCPRCGEMFAGFECGGTMYEKIEGREPGHLRLPGGGNGTCRFCPGTYWQDGTEFDFASQKWEYPSGY